MRLSPGVLAGGSAGSRGEGGPAGHPLPLLKPACHTRVPSKPDVPWVVFPRSLSGDSITLLICSLRFLNRDFHCFVNIHSAEPLSLGLKPAERLTSGFGMRAQLFTAGSKPASEFISTIHKIISQFEVWTHYDEIWGNYF